MLHLLHSCFWHKVGGACESLQIGHSLASARLQGACMAHWAQAVIPFAAALLPTRYVPQVLYDIGAVSTPEPFHRLVSQVGLGLDGLVGASPCLGCAFPGGGRAEGVHTLPLLPSPLPAHMRACTWSLRLSACRAWSCVRWALQCTLAEQTP